MHTTADTGAPAETEGDCVDFFLHPVAALLHQRRDFGQPGVEHKGAGVQHFDKSAAQAQKELGMDFHGAAHIHQHRDPGRATAHAGAAQGNQFAAGGQCAAHGAAQVDGAHARIVPAAAGELAAQAALERDHQRLKAVQIAGQPLGKVALVGRCAAAGTGLRLLRTGAFRIARSRVVGQPQMGLGRAGRRVGHGLRHVLVHLLHQLLQVAGLLLQARGAGGGAHLVREPEGLVQFGVFGPLLVAARSNRTPQRFGTRPLRQRQRGGGLQHQADFGITERKTVRAQIVRKVGELGARVGSGLHGPVRLTSCHRQHPRPARCAARRSACPHVRV